MKALIHAYIERLQFKKINQITWDFGIRLLSLIIFPFVYLLLSLFNLFYPIKLGFLYRVRIGHLISNTDFYLRRRYLGTESKSLNIFFVYKPANQQVCNMFQRVMPLVQSEVLTKLFAPISVFNTKFVLNMPFIGNEYLERVSAPPPVAFTPFEIEQGELKLREMGIGSEDWYVCIHARDNAYTLTLPGGANYIDSGNYRNADIDTYILAAQEVIKRGGYVVRIGSVVEKEFSLKHPKVIDYPFENRDDFSDVYVSSKAKFFISTANGAVDFATLLDVPVLLVNVVPIGFSPLSKRSIYIPKRMQTVTGAAVKFRDQLSFFQKIPLDAIVNPLNLMKEKDWHVLDNTAEEILDATKELFELLDNDFNYSDEAQLLIEQYRSLFEVNNIHKDCKAPCAVSFLRTLDLS